MMLPLGWKYPIYFFNTLACHSSFPPTIGAIVANPQPCAFVIILYQSSLLKIIVLYTI